MKTFASNLKERARELDISNSEVARRSGLSESRYGHYVSGRSEPDLATLVRISKTLQTTPNALLDVDAQTESSTRALLEDRLNSAAQAMSESQLEMTVIQAEALISNKTQK